MPPRAWYLAAGFVIMCFNSLYQYTWNLLAPMIGRAMGLGVLAEAVGFTIYVIVSTVAQPAGGALADLRGPRGVGALSAVLSALGFIGAALAPGPALLYLAWGLGSAGEGVLYGIAFNLAVKWYQDKLGLATGLVSLGFGLGSAVANPLIASVGNYREATLAIGVVELLVLVPLSLLVDYPRGLSGVSPRRALLDARFWTLYASYALGAVPLLSLASSLHLLVGGGELVLLASLYPLLVGAARPLLGALADKWGPLKAIYLALAVSAAGTLAMLAGLDIVGVIAVGLTGGAIIILYLNLSSRIFGPKYATANNGLLYTAKAVGGTLGSAAFGYVYALGGARASLLFAAASALAAMAILAAQRGLERPLPRDPQL
ncbi:MFS transporter [Thermoproteus tenax]|uniref:Uncharacterized 38 kDa protein in 23S RNA operon n=2 Tax=Thermoproteus tenax TaxID=2271 RepID=Y38K_THETE|nr:MFS transporter [Thermoproteus tenax]P05715.1 RecName: Full=Uncharacterized 38 kDa protein in 23S RNA operon [Thermoproteus tenax]CAA29514.1 unnamed protein product [Thermoproteus tenax]CCC82571.1 Permease, major facilitator superfamily [Thermoproteus tenax Kra 1]